MMNSALIGYSGFVGSSLLRQTSFAAQYRSTTIADIRGQAFDLVVCAGAPAQKWLANRAPADDEQKIQALMQPLQDVDSRVFVLISTVDVFQDPRDVDEASAVSETGLHAYGLHRLRLERFVAERFPRHLIVRLPGLVGPGLRKNIIFDFLNQNNLHAIDSRAQFQFYPMVNLWPDIQTALEAGLSLVHLTAEPVSVADVARHGFGRSFEQVQAGMPAQYAMRTRHAALFGGQGAYQYSARESLLAIRAYAQSEARTLPAPAGAA